MTDDPRWRAASAAKASHGAELMRRYGAHGLGVAWVRVGSERQPGLLLVADAVPDRVPDPVLVDVDGSQYAVPLVVHQAPPDRFEAAGPN